MLKCSINVGQVETFLQKASALIKEYIIKSLSTLAKESADKARNRGEDISWYNLTGSLRSSIGAAVYDHGITIMRTSFEPVLAGSKGSAEGKMLIQELSKLYQKTVAMVIVAAMDYADIVEALDNKDVLDSVRIWAESIVEGRIKKAVEEAMATINTWKL